MLGNLHQKTAKTQWVILGQIESQWLIWHSRWYLQTMVYWKNYWDYRDKDQNPYLWIEWAIWWMDRKECFSKFKKNSTIAYTYNSMSVPSIYYYNRDKTIIPVFNLTTPVYALSQAVEINTLQPHWFNDLI